MKSLSAEAKISSESDFKRYIAFPLVEGMGVVTAVYHGDLIPKIQGREGILTFEKFRFSEKPGNTQFYRAEGGNSETWLISVTLPNTDETFELSKNKEGAIHFVEGSKAVDGLIIQIAITSSEDGTETEKVYQQTAGMYVTGTKFSGDVNCETVNYKIQYETEGSSEIGKPISSRTMQGYLSNELLFSHKVDNKVQWLPYLRNNEKLEYTKEQMELIRKTAREELEGVDIEQTVLNMGNHYFVGKVLDKFAHLLYVVDEFLNDEVLTKAVLKSMKGFFKTFRERKGERGFFYDTKFGGVTSKSAFRNVKNGEVDPGNINIDFGNGLYNNHNHDYSYYIHAAAVVGKIDKKFGGNWVSENKDFINTFVRDVANPSEEDSFFPVFRLFDIFQGHSWAHGITNMRDGKSLQSTSEDVNFSYAMKMWGQVIGDEAMEARGNLMLSIQKASFNLYFLYQDDNKVVAPTMLKNRVSGLLFEAKLAYETWFGSNPEFINGIQMLPLTPALGLVRSASFAQKEWDEILGKLSITSQWAGILNSNRVFFDPKSAWNYFSNPQFDYQNDMDGGQSRTWNLVFSAPFFNQKPQI
ncbi:glycoside hydrolase [Metschnikowia bicuspidata var. bicuspidata NRRL YB-4993]|uniref:glucan endo-1,3-beta-D-glucosidase n=1 Tax=Metschnikowia bicuspidata var. bicuspidata NRRL YB-4993 TaxID=869754 RepID=A0A1A0HET7_9ASCO|nr:glycoside hydrolase [Metschnikowia bicuspidata var. bicuspidata NRRL YB-4993]OBA22402.1 glycoside hydrolase [Metschnikowia bicuspidata var. bicuspidata NRRL YB-4993]